MSEEKLSVRLTTEAWFRSRSGDFSAWVPESDKALATLLTEAAHFARLVEEAPTHTVSAMPGTNGGFGVIAVPGDLVDQRVRLVREQES